MAHDNAHRMQPEPSSENHQLTDIQLTTASQDGIALPVETIYHILRLSGPQDLICLQLVSKLFHEVIKGPALWRAVYSTTRLPLPPGPFPWQSTRFLQRALVYSARLANTWTTEPLTLISSKIFTGPRSIEEDRFRWVRGRWLIVSKDMKQLRSRDVETGSERVLWDHGSFAHWGATSVIVLQGHFMYVVVHLGRGRLTDPVKLLEFVVDDDTGCLSGPEMLDVPTWSLPREDFIPQVRVDSGIVPYAYVSLCPTNKPRHSLVFDPRHRRFHKFPRFRTRLDILLNYRGAWLPHLVEVYFAQTHLFVLSRSYLIHGNIGEVEVVQTFALPDIDATNPTSSPNPSLEPTRSEGDGSAALSAGPAIGSHDDRHTVVDELRLTHEMITRDLGSTWLVLIRDAVVDPITQSTTLRFMHTYAPFYPAPDMRVRLVCTDYTLPAPRARPTSSTATTPTVAAGTHRMRDDQNNSNLNAIVRSAEDVLPITTAFHDILSVPGVWKGNLVDVSGDGFVRGFCMVGRPYRPRPCPRLHPHGEDRGGGSDCPNEMIHKFAVDATGDRCVAVVGDPSPLWRDLDPTRHYSYSLDGTRGKMWYTKGGVQERNATGELIDRDVLAIVIDFK